jgi:hypothetical protein
MSIINSQLVTGHPAKQAKFDLFATTLAKHYEYLFASNTDYAYAASRTNPTDLARKMTIGLSTGQASKDGDGIKLTCKELGIKNTYKAIREYLGV